MIAGLIDNRNLELFKELNKNYEIEVELVNHTNEYGCYSINNSSTILLPLFIFRANTNNASASSCGLL